MRHSGISFVFMVVALFSTSCVTPQPSPQPSSEKIRINPLREGKALPAGYQWVLASNEQGKSLLSIATLLTPTREDGTLIEQPYVLQCDSAVRTDLGNIASVLVRPDNTTPLPSSAYFTVDPTLVYSQLNFADASTKFDAKVGAKIPGPVKIATSGDVTTVRTNLFIVFTRSEIAATQAYIDCMTNSLRNAGITGRVRIPAGMVVGGALVLTFDADAVGVGANVDYSNLVNADLRVDFSRISLEYYQWGSTKGLGAPELLEPLRLPTPNPIKPVQTFIDKTSQYGFVAVRHEVKSL